MSALERYNGGGEISQTRDARRTMRGLSRTVARTAIRSSEVEAEEDLAVLKVQSATHVIGQGLLETTKLQKLFNSLELMSPEASPRMAALLDQAGLTVLSICDQHARKITRL